MMGEWIAEHVSVSAIAQISILYFVIYAILKAARGSRFGQALMGVGIIATLMFAFTFVFQFDVLSRLMQALLVYLAISPVVVFQPEIRRILSQVGAFGYFEKPRYDADGAATPEFIVDVILALAERRVGALLAFERGISLKSYESTGVPVNAVFSRELVTCIFTPPLPLHDGGVTLRAGKIAYAHCVFPVSGNPDLVGSGMRHRAAVGLSEETDALVVVVSEESGSVSIAHNGRLIRYTGEDRRQSVLRWITKTMDARQRRQNPILSLYERIARKVPKK